jgi:SAM-dependent methyltransferase
MPSVEENNEKWSTYDWQHGGHEWSHYWGSAADQWVNTIYPRIYNLIPTSNVVEIAPGYGRWTPFLLNNCSKYIGIDISEPLINHCRRVFSALDGRPAFFVGDGLHFPNVRESTIDFIFSFDSLVHAELDCITSYISEIGRVLVPGGHAFIHHSNIGEYVEDGKLTVANPGWRGTSVTAEIVHDLVRSAGLVSLIHEKIGWVLLEGYTDCFTLIHKPPGPEREQPHTAPRIYYNEDFGAEIRRSSQISNWYTTATSGR